MPDLAALQPQLGHFFRDESLLRLALTHPSVAHEPVPRVEGEEIQRRSEPHNQRLEFLGDAVLQVVLTRELYERFPSYNEGLLTKARARLVNRRVLAGHGRGLGLGAHLILSRGEESHGGRERPSALADAFEALLGAIFLDGGLDAVREFILREFREGLDGLTLVEDSDNPKGRLQELLQARSSESPQYQIVSVSGPDHDRVFECTVWHGNVELARGQGKSKKTAESDAAQAALNVLQEQKQAPV
jgi:ribonuclease III